MIRTKINKSNNKVLWKLGSRIYYFMLKHKKYAYHTTTSGRNRNYKGGRTPASFGCARRCQNAMAQAAVLRQQFTKIVQLQIIYSYITGLERISFFILTFRQIFLRLMQKKVAVQIYAEITLH